MASPPELLAHVPLFEELEAEDLQWIARAVHPRAFSEGDHLFEIGEPGRSLFIVTGGIVQVLHPSQPEGFQLARVGPGEFLGEMALLDDSPRSATAKAAGPVETLVLDKAEFHRLVLERPEVAFKLLEVMSRRIRRADEQISLLGREAVRDPLTGLFNRLAFEARLEHEAARTRRYGTVFSVILIDLRDFSMVRDAFGPATGDRILAWVGRLLREHTRVADVRFRLEGDVFAVLCPETRAERTGRLSLRLATLVSEAKPPGDQELRLTLVAGTATCPDHAQEGPPLYAHALRSLQAAKAKS
jgi:CRP/FNR family cyclic AMP-dependent transcriptional regulator